ncbi:MAG: UDP-N-acetylmuramate--L-alanine ligase, partial [Actinomycetota bacterium]
GMSGVALALAGMGHEVSGSDIHEGSVISRLRDAGVVVSIGHDSHLIDDCQAVTASPAIPAHNVEVAAAKEKGIFISRAGMLASICAIEPTIAVAGTHGKTTTTSVLVHIFEAAELEPNFVVGGDVKDFGTNARWTGGPWTIVEADESDGTHLELPLHGTILTNIDVDHLDHYGDYAGIVDAFERYLAGIDGPKVVCSDDDAIVGLLQSSDGRSDYVTYGAGEEADFRFEAIESAEGMTTFHVVCGDICIPVETSLRGVHNVSNITGAIAMAVVCGVDPMIAGRAVRSFTGVGRRFDVRGRIDGVTLVDDYAHLPREIDAVLTAARTSGDSWRRIVAVFQPNRFNRMSRISHEYADAFRSADLIVLTDIYSSGTARIAGVTGRLVVDAVLERHPHAEVVWVEKREELAVRVSELLESGDVCISMGCGDIETLPDEVLAVRRSAGEM